MRGKQKEKEVVIEEEGKSDRWKGKSDRGSASTRLHSIRYKTGTKIIHENVIKVFFQDNKIWKFKIKHPTSPCHKSGNMWPLGSFLAST